MVFLNRQDAKTAKVPQLPFRMEKASGNALRLRGSILLAALLIVGCGTKFPLPTENEDSTYVFSSGDTSYIRISPDWDAANGFSLNTPWDLLVGADGYIYVADREEQAIKVYNRAGVATTTDAFGNDFSALLDLTAPDGSPISPMALSQDPYLNLFIADSSNRLYAWNQYVNNVGIDSVAERVAFRSGGDRIWVSNPDSFLTLMSSGYRVADVEWTTEGIDSLLAVSVFWDGNDPTEATRIRRYFMDPDSMSLTGVASHADVEGLVFAGDAHSNSVARLTYRSKALVMTGLGDELLLYCGMITERPVSVGTGNGTAQDPRGMAIDKQGALYYAQWGENFGVHKVGGSPGFDLGMNNIMDLDRYAMPSDVCVDFNGMIYVADTGHDMIQQFDANGMFTFNIGVTRVSEFTTVTDSSYDGTEWTYTTRDTLLFHDVADILAEPRSVAVDEDGIVYIADTGNQRIMRYRLSTDLEYEEPQ